MRAAFMSRAKGEGSGLCFFGSSQIASIELNLNYACLIAVSVCEHTRILFSTYIFMDKKWLK